MYNALGGLTAYKIPNIAVSVPPKMPQVQAVYVLRCKDVIPTQYKWYVGITNNLTRRLEDHNTGRGAEWTKFYKVDCLWDYVFTENPFIENLITLMYMASFGPDNVRGGPHTQMVLDHHERRFIDAAIRSARGECMKCGSPHHFIAECGNPRIPEGGKKSVPPTPSTPATVALLAAAGVSPSTIAYSSNNGAASNPAEEIAAAKAATIISLINEDYIPRAFNAHGPTESAIVADFVDADVLNWDLIKILEKKGIVLSLADEGTMIALSGNTFEYRTDIGRACEGAATYDKTKKIWYFPNTENIRSELARLFR